MDVLKIKNSHDGIQRPVTLEEIKKPLVLIVEDHEDTRFTLRTMLEVRGIEVVEAGSGEEAIDAAVVMRPDLILMDLNLPTIDGLEAARLIRVIASFDNVPIVFLSGNTHRSFRIKAFAVGGNDYLVKPLDFKRMDSILEKFLFRANGAQKKPDLNLS